MPKATAGRAFRRFNLDQLESPYVALTPSPARLRRVLSGPGLSDSEVEDLFRAANYRGDGRLDYLQWSDFLALLRLGDEESVAAAALVRPGLSPDSLFALLTPAATVTLSSDERSRLKAVLRRADALARAASSAKVAVMVCWGRRWAGEGWFGEKLHAALPRTWALGVQVDAEQTYMQPAIDWVTLTMQRKYNRPDPAAWEQPEAAHVVRLHKAHEQAQPILRPAHARASSLLSTLAPTPVPPPHAGPPVSAEHAVVFGTVQAYTVDAVPRLQLLLARAQREGFMQATKLVRGAYMVQERARASQLGYKDPIHRGCRTRPSNARRSLPTPCPALAATLEATHAAFHDCSELLLEAVSKRQAAALFATHNEASVVHLARRMQDLGLAPAGESLLIPLLTTVSLPRRVSSPPHQSLPDPRVSFGQLLGMCDHLTYSLAAAKFRAFKYIPYGPVHEVGRSYCARSIDAFLHYCRDRRSFHTSFDARKKIVIYCMEGLATRLLFCKLSSPIGSDCRGNEIESERRGITGNDRPGPRRPDVAC